MTKSKKIGRALAAWGQIVAIVACFVTGYIMIDQRFDQIDSRLDGVDRRLDSVERRLERLEIRLEKLESVVYLDLAWRYLYQNDPARKHLRPLYHPDTKTLELVPITAIDPTAIRKP